MFANRVMRRISGTKKKRGSNRRLEKITFW
jgi:hypothetical protein